MKRKDEEKLPPLPFKKKQLEGERKGVELKNIFARIPKLLHDDISRIADHEEKSLYNIVSRALRNYVESYAKAASKGTNIKPEDAFPSLREPLEDDQS